MLALQDSGIDPDEYSRLPDKATSGTYRVAGQDIATLDADALAQLRREHFGFIFQRYHLLPHLTAEQNVEVPAVLCRS